MLILLQKQYFALCKLYFLSCQNQIFGYLGRILLRRLK